MIELNPQYKVTLSMQNIGNMTFCGLYSERRSVSTLIPFQTWVTLQQGKKLMNFPPKQAVTLVTDSDQIKPRKTFDLTPTINPAHTRKCQVYYFSRRGGTLCQSCG